MEVPEELAAPQAECPPAGKKEGLRLSHQLADGLLPLAAALAYAADVASALRDLHSNGLAHGAVGANSVQLGPRGATLMAPREFREHTGQASDVRAFGALLHEMIAGSKPAGETVYLDASQPARCEGPEGLRTGLLRLAGRCLQASDVPQPHMQQVFTELRLYRLRGQQIEWASAAGAPALGSLPTAIPGPCSVTAAQKQFLLLEEEAFGMLEPSGVKCPHCSSPFVYPSRTRTILEKLMGGIGIRLFRCHRCLYRYGVALQLVFSKGSPLN